MIIIGLTGGIASGKSTIAAQFKKLGAAVYDADRAVHKLLASGGAGVALVARRFPAAKKGEYIDRKTLAAEVFGNPQALADLERILHPLVHEEERVFLKKARTEKKEIAVLEIPLLFETDADERCDITVLATAPHFLQRQRAMLRPQMRAEALDAILARQMPHHHKRRRADIVIDTGLGKAYSFRRVKAIVAALQRMREVQSADEGIL